MTRASGKTTLVCDNLINMFNDDDLIVCMYDDNPYVKALCRTSLNVIVVNETSIYKILNMVKTYQGNKYLVADPQTCQIFTPLFTTIIIC